MIFLSMSHVFVFCVILLHLVVDSENYNKKPEIYKDLENSLTQFFYSDHMPPLGLEAHYLTKSLKVLNYVVSFG